jgi:peptide methionine sulfoxide reductase MsrB
MAVSALMRIECRAEDGMGYDGHIFSRMGSEAYKSRMEIKLVEAPGER